MPLPARTRRLFAAWLLFLVPAAIAVAQLAESHPAERPPGDTITLTNGAQMSGVHVLRKTATNYLVQVVDGVVMSIPVSQVSEIDYDESRRPGGRSGTLAHGEGNGEEILAQEMAPALNNVLTRPLAEPLSMVDEDLFFVLDAVAIQFGFEVEVRESLHAIPPEERRWTFEIPQEATLLRLFRDDLPARFPALVAVPQFDRVVVTTRQDAEESGLIAAPHGNEVEATGGATEP